MSECRRNLPPTPAQLQTLDAIRTLMVRTGLSPTLDEIAGKLGISKPAVCDRLISLEQAGCIECWTSCGPI